MRHLVHARVRHLAAQSLLLAGLIACGAKHPAVEPERVALRVDNRGYYDVAVYALRSTGTSGLRIGTVSGSSTATLRVPVTELQASSRLVVQLRATGTRYTWTSPAVQISPGTVARLNIVSNSSGDMTGSSLYSELSGN